MNESNIIQNTIHIPLYGKGLRGQSGHQNVTPGVMSVQNKVNQARLSEKYTHQIVSSYRHKKLEEVNWKKAWNKADYRKCEVVLE